MTSHRPSRWIAPLALLAAVAAVFAVVSASTGDGDSGGGQAATSARESGRTSTQRGGTSTGRRTTTTPQRRTYTVRPGDTLAGIAEKTGLSVEELQELNPRLDPNNLTVGTKIRLTE